MNSPPLSNHFKNRSPSSIRRAQIEFSKREDIDSVDVVNLAIGNISLPMYPAMRKRLNQLGSTRFSDGVVKYTSSNGNKEARKAFLNILEAEGIDSTDIFSMVTDGGSAAMELMLLGVCGPSSKNPLMLLDPTYTNYTDFANRLSIPITTMVRNINSDGYFSEIDLAHLESLIIKKNPSGILIIPYDNPTGQYLSIKVIRAIAELAIKYDKWLISDEAYRSLVYNNKKISSIWALNEIDLPGIKGRRISIESSSKVWNACGLRIGGLLTDNLNFHEKAVSEYTANLCANALGQEIFGAMANEPHQNIRKWQFDQRIYYSGVLNMLKDEFEKELPGLIVTKPEAAIYFIIDFRNIAPKDFNAVEFIDYCAKSGKVKIKNKFYTLLLSPMSGFYSSHKNGIYQMRVAMVDEPNRMKIAPILLSKLYNDYINNTQ